MPSDLLSSYIKISEFCYFCSKLNFSKILNGPNWAFFSKHKVFMVYFFRLYVIIRTLFLYYGITAWPMFKYYDMALIDKKLMLWVMAVYYGLVYVCRCKIVQGWALWRLRRKFVHGRKFLKLECPTGRNWKRTGLLLKLFWGCENRHGAKVINFHQISINQLFCYLHVWW